MTDIGGYHLLNKVAAGGMAEVFLARATTDEALVIVKRMLPQFAHLPEYVEMFFDEGRVVSLLRHPNIVRMREFGFQDELPFLAMEYLPGVDLHKLLKQLRVKHERMPLQVALYIVACMCAGLHHTHEACSIDGRPMGIIHRDISPQNVVLTVAGGVKLIDFGIAKSVEREHETKGGTLKGKVRYMSPEQLRGVELDRRSDVYSVGVLLYELAVGHSPYIDEQTKGDPVGEFGLMMAVTRNSVLPPAGIAPELAHIIVKAMAPTPAERYQSCAELLLELEAVAQRFGWPLEAVALARVLKAQFGDLSALPASLGASGAVDDDPYDSAEIEAATQARVEPTVVAPPSVAMLQARLQATPAPSRSSLLHAKPISATMRVAGADGVHVIVLASNADAAHEQVQNAVGMSGALLFDFGQVTRFPQESIKAWLDFHDVMATRRDCEIYFSSCGPALVKQAARARSLLGEAHLVSLGMPCLCLTCGEHFDHVVDCEHDVAVLQGPLLTSVMCPFCGGRATVDDDTSFRVATARYWGRPVPAAIRKAMADVAGQRRELETIEKTIDGQHTQIRVRKTIDRQLRWPRLFDGLEGDVTLDLALASLDDAALDGLRRALPDVTANVASVTLCGIPAALLAKPLPSASNLRVESVACRCFCRVCDAYRLCVVAAPAWQAMVAKGRIAIACPGCRTELRPDAVEGSTSPGTRRSAARLPVSRRPEGGWRTAVVALVVLGVIALVSVVVLALVR